MTRTGRLLYGLMLAFVSSAVFVQTAVAQEINSAGDCLPERNVQKIDWEKIRPFYRAQFNADGSLLLITEGKVTGGNNGTTEGDDADGYALAVFDTKAQKLLWQVPQQTALNRIDGLSEDGKLLLVTCARMPEEPEAGMVVRWPVITGVEILNAQTGTFISRLEDKSPDGQANLLGNQQHARISEPIINEQDSLIVAQVKDEIRGWDISSGKNRFAFRPPERVSIGLSGDGQTLTGISGRNIYLWSVADGKLIKKISVPGNGVDGTQISPDLKYLIGEKRLKFELSRVQVWRVSDGALIYSAEGYDNPEVHGFTKDGKLEVIRGIEVEQLDLTHPKQAPVRIDLGKRLLSIDIQPVRNRIWLIMGDWKWPGAENGRATMRIDLNLGQMESR